jgi:hypothetical protein
MVALSGNLLCEFGRRVRVSYGHPVRQLAVRVL